MTATNMCSNFVSKWSSPRTNLFRLIFYHTHTHAHTVNNLYTHTGIYFKHTGNYFIYTHRFIFYTQTGNISHLHTGFTHTHTLVYIFTHT